MQDLLDMRTPLVTVVILNWNGKEYLAPCLESVLGQSYPRFRTVVVDNGSRDGSVQLIEKKYSDSLTLIRNEKNLGFAEGNNRAIDYALDKGTDYICLLNNDAVVDRGFLLPLIRAAESDGRIGILGPRVYFHHRPRRIWSEGIRVNSRTGRVVTPLYRRSDREAGNAVREWDAVSGAALLIKKKVIEKTGRLEADYFVYYEDVDWCVRARRNGFRVITVPSSRVRHRVSSSLRGGTSPVTMYYLVRNHLLLMDRNFPLSSPFLGRGRELRIIAYNLGFLLVASKINKNEGMRALIRGIKHYYQKQFGPIPDHL